jgi:hypothetical protein
MNRKPVHSCIFWAEETPVVGILGELPGPIIASLDLGNLSE